jgi:hypothetical protein
MGKKLSKEETKYCIWLRIAKSRKWRDWNSMYPAIAAELNLPAIRRFKTFTADLLLCRDLPVSCGILY